MFKERAQPPDINQLLWDANSIGTNEFLTHQPDQLVQNQIIHFFTYNKPNIFTENHIPTNESLKKQFLDQLRSGTLNFASNYSFLNLVPANYKDPFQLKQALKTEFGSHRKAISIFLEREDIDYELAFSVVSLFPTPEIPNYMFYKYAKKNNDGSSVFLADSFLHFIYNRRQTAYEQFKLLLKESKNPPKPAPEITRSFEGIRFRAFQPGFIETDSSKLRAKITELEKRVSNLVVENISLKASLAQANLERDAAQLRAIQAEARLREQSSRMNKDPQGYYAILGLDPSIKDLPEEAIQALIKGARRALGLAYHTDRSGGGDLEKMRKANAAADFLSDPIKRRTYS